MRRREFITLLGGAAVAWPVAARAQVSARRPLVGWLGVASAASVSPLMAVFLQGMRELGYTHGRDFEVADRYADGHASRLPQLAEELVRLNPDVILTAADVGARALKEATATIPIVCFGLGDPVGLGWAANDARPTGNITGIRFSIATLTGKLLQFAREVLPQARKVGFLYQPPRLESYTTQVDADAAALGIERFSLEVNSPDQLSDAFKALAQARVEALIIGGSPLFFSERRRLAELSVAARLPLIMGLPEAVADGALIAYGTNARENARRAAAYVDKILKGATPSELPIELPTKLELLINLKTARALGLDVPPLLLARADEVIE